MSGWKNAKLASPSWMTSWYKPWGGSKETNLAVTKPSTGLPSASASGQPGSTAVAGETGTTTNFWTGATRPASANIPANYPATGQPYSYPTQPAAGYQANAGATATATPAVGYQTGPYGMTSTPAATAPAASSPGYAQAAQSWNMPAQGAQPAATVPTTGYGAPAYQAAQQPAGYAAQPAAGYQASGGYQMADQRGTMTGGATTAPAYGPTATYGAAAGYGSPSNPAPSSTTPSYGTPAYGSGQPAAGGYQAPASSGGYQGYSAPASEPSTYGSGSPYSNQGASTGSGNNYSSAAVYQPDTQPQPAASASPSQFAMPASLTTSGGYRPGSTGRNDVQNAGYDSTAAAPSASPTYNAPTYGNTYTR
jgi:hypothetical protein